MVGSSCEAVCLVTVCLSCVWATCFEDDVTFLIGASDLYAMEISYSSCQGSGVEIRSAERFESSSL